MVDAAVKFQVMHDLPNTGNIGKMTWQILFSEDALPMVNEYEYLQILGEYEARKALEEEAEKVADAVTVKAASAASKGAMNITWTLTQESTGDEVLDTEIAALLPADAGVDAYFDGFEVWKSSSKTSGYKQVRDTAKLTYKNTSGLKKGSRYYYKVRAYKLVGEEKIYTGWSNITYKKAK